MPAFILDKGECAARFNALDEFTQAYLECALWLLDEEIASELGRGAGTDASLDDLSEEAWTDAVADCLRWRSTIGPAAAAHAVRENPRKAGHDFWLTRNHHGSGFWETDRWPEEIGHALTNHAHAAGERDLYAGDDGKLYFA